MIKNAALAIAFILLASSLTASSTLWIQSSSAESIPKPSVPEFTVVIADHSYEVPSTTPTYTIDPYTGEQKQVTSGSPSYRVENKSIEITVKNQPFTPYTDSSGNYIQLYYNIRSKGHYGDKWFYDPFNPDGESSQSFGGWDMTSIEPYTASNSEYTIITRSISGIPDNGTEDFQVQAQIGYIRQEGSDLMRRAFGVRYNFTGESSDWSNTQTITVYPSSSAPTATVNPTISPTNPSTMPTDATTPTAVPTQSGNQTPFDLNTVEIAILAVLIIIALLIAVLILTLRRR